MLTTFWAFLGYSSEQPSEIDTIMIHILQMKELKKGGILNSPEVTPSLRNSRDFSTGNPTPEASSPTPSFTMLLYARRTWVYVFFITMIINMG